MSADLDVRPDADEGSRATGTHGRNRLTWLVAAAAAAVIAGVGGVRCLGLSATTGTAAAGAPDHARRVAPSSTPAPRWPA